MCEFMIDNRETVLNIIVREHAKEWILRNRVKLNGLNYTFIYLKEAIMI